MNYLSLTLCVLAMIQTSANARVLRASNLEPVPADPTSIESQLKRFKGQTQFLNLSGSTNRFRDQMGAQQQQQQQEGDDRDEQEADVFKVGKPGSKLLYLLNDYRGLQVVSYAKGTAHPELVGRVEATGNMPENMYYDAANDQLIVLETIEDWGSDYYRYTPLQSRVLVYDVSQPTAPKLASVLPIEGEIADSRMVGNVLYLASSIRPDWDDVRPLEKSSKGVVYSLQLTKNELKVKEKLPLALPTSARENMNIVSVKEGQATRYYLLAVLSESRWGWWDRQSLVEVVDITDPDGHIESKMVVSAKGQIQKKSQTTIKNNTLVVVSNYTPPGTGALMRVAVETFGLPTAKSEIISEDESLRRKLNIDHALEGLSGSELDTRRAAAISDPKEGLLGRFVKTAQGVRKIFADSVVTVGDDTGLHASLRDVRFENDLLYVFWVPANQIDPLDVFDMRAPEKGIAYLKRLKFDGWIERSIPVRFQNRNFIFGLGYVVPVVNNENRSRKPQIVLFEVTKSGNDVQAVERTKVVLEKDAYANFNASDKEIELKMGDQGSGSILYSTSFREGRHWVEGGKLAHFDLTKLEIKEGGFLKGDAQWLRRVFTNSEIDRINTLTDESLATFDVNEQVAAGSVGHAISILELARDIRGYAVVDTQSQGSYGVQIINKDSDETDTSTILRLVDANQADAELKNVYSEFVLTGEYQSHYTAADGTLWIAVEKMAPENTPAGQRSMITQVYQLNVKNKRLQSGDAITLPGFSKKWWGNGKFQKLADGAMIYSDGKSAMKIQGRQGLAIKLEDCEVEKRRVDAIQVLNGRLYAALVETIDDPALKDVRYDRNFVAAFNFSGDIARCGAAINIPGRATTWNKERMITEDRRLIDVGGPRAGGREEDNALESLHVSGNQAQLVDDFVFATTSYTKRGYSDFEDDYVKFSDEKFGYFDSSRFVSVSLNADQTFARETFVTPNELIPDSHLVKVVADPSESGAVIGILANYDKFQVVRWSRLSARPSIVPISVMGSDQKLTTPATSMPSPMFMLMAEDEDIDTFQMSYSPETKSLQVPMSYLGVVQLYLK